MKKVFILFFLWVYLSTSTYGKNVDSVLSTLSPLEKIGQMILVYHSPPQFLLKHHIGGVLIMSPSLKKPNKMASQIDSVQKKSKIGLLVTIDQEGGRINRLQSFPEWKKTPSAYQLSAWTHDSIESHTQSVGNTLRTLNINMNLGPVLDPTHNHKGKETFLYRWERSFGRDAKTITNPALAYISGFRKADIFCVSKHFPGYDIAENSDLTISVSHADSQSILLNAHPFSLTSSAVSGVMMSSIIYSQVEKKPAVLSPFMINLARQADRNLMIMTDDLWGEALRRFVSPKDTIQSRYPDKAFAKLVEMAFWAGNDVLMITYPDKVKVIQKTLLALIEKDSSANQRLNESCRRILSVKAKMDLL